MATNATGEEGRVNKYPPGVPYIIGNEAAERFSFYGMKAILWIYLTTLFVNFVPIETVDAATRTAMEAKATARVHLFVAAVYAFPMIGALIADRLFGKYRVIMWLSIVYCIGHGVLAVAGHSEQGVYIGLALIAIGSGGIKPCVSANVGDQFTKSNSHLIPRIYQIFYFSINFGSFFSTLLTPWLYKKYGPDVAFGVPGILMAIATFVFWLGRDKFVKVPPNPGGKLGVLDALASISLFMVFAPLLFGAGAPIWARAGVAGLSLLLFLVFFNARQSIEPSKGFISVLMYSIQNQRLRKPGMGFFDVARAKFGDEAAEGPPAVLKIAVVFSMVSLFWALFDQHASSWVNQANRMDLDLHLPLFGLVALEASQISALNPVLVMLMIPLLNVFVYPPLQRMGVVITPLRKMTTGMILASLAFVTVALLQTQVDANPKGVNVFWQLIPYILMTLSEVLVSITGLEFAYTQAPKSMKSTIMGFWLLTVTVGNLLVAFLAGFESLPLVQFFWIFAGLMGVAAMIFGVLAYFYRGKTYIQEDTAAA